MQNLNSLRKFTLIEGGGEGLEKQTPPLTLIKGYKGMVTVNKLFLGNKEGIMAFAKLMKTDMTHDAAYKVQKFVDFLQQEGKKYEAAQVALLKEHTELDEKGEPVKELNDKGEATGYKFKDMAVANEAFKKLAEENVVIEVTPLFAVEIQGLKLTPVEWQAIKPFIADPSNLTTA